MLKDAVCFSNEEYFFTHSHANSQWNEKKCRLFALHTTHVQLRLRVDLYYIAIRCSVQSDMYSIATHLHHFNFIFILLSNKTQMHYYTFYSTKTSSFSLSKRPSMPTKTVVLAAKSHQAQTNGKRLLCLVYLRRTPNMFQTNCKMVWTIPLKSNFFVILYGGGGTICMPVFVASLASQFFSLSLSFGGFDWRAHYKFLFDNAHSAEHYFKRFTFVHTHTHTHMREHDVTYG